MNKFPIRTATKAIIIKEGKILLNKYNNGKNIWYTFPGGGQDHNEDLKSNLKRECLEEMGADVEVLDVLFVREFIADNHNPSPSRTGYHQVNIIFECYLIDENFVKPSQPDPNQIGVEWVKIDELLNYNLYPLSIRKDIIEHYTGNNNKIYLGETD
ncbi:NUDIX domain-containing protein [Thiospirochaeta perfilievii]|uniref:NUDIX domain-containing protein n=1 Tax=Thiospirochaeta perfilievii TaxID=252967 RepID=A0A5C1Q9S5_9SPIO|nr:NUDIX domain-containing protein [Thiospirochaeta perfilievii]QEN04883.1 NUDIX domain-containing protein [Thiospirochaeta perfilievii]